MLEFLGSFLLLSLVVCGITSGFLYSSLLEEMRFWWLEYFKNSKLKDYATCALCLSVPTTLLVEWLFLPYIGIIYYILFAFGIACVSWALSTWVTKCGWERCLAKEKYKELIGKDVK